MLKFLQPVLNKHPCKDIGFCDIFLEENNIFSWLGSDVIIAFPAGSTVLYARAQENKKIGIWNKMLIFHANGAPILILRE